MGSFNAGCGLSNLSVDPGDKVGFLLLLPSLSGRNPSADCGKTLQVYTHDLFNPFLPPIFGTYDDYGSITNIQPSTTTALLESMFGLETEQILSLISSNDHFYSKYGGAANAYLTDPDTCLVDSFGVSEAEVLASVGFTVTGEGSYQFEEYTLLKIETDGPVDFGGKFYTWFVEKNGKQVKLRSGEDVILAQSLYMTVDNFASLTGAFPGVDKKHWSNISLLRKMSGMFFLEEVFTGLKKAVVDGPDEYLIREFDSFQNDFVVEKMLGEEIAEVGDTDLLPKNLLTSNSYLLRELSFPRDQVERLAAYKDDKDDFFNIFALIQIATAVNRLLQPSFNGEQFGNTDASLALNKLTGKILRQRKSSAAEYDD